MNLILASASPRRLALLAQAGIAAQAVPADIDETQRADESAAQACLRFAREKAAAVSMQFPDTAVLAADTIGILDGRLLGKPRSEDDAYAMLHAMAGRSHTVLTAFCIRRGQQEFYASSETTVQMMPFDEDTVRRYIASGEPMDKAGAYGIQGAGALFIERIDGDFYTVVGLPIAAVCRALHSFGIDALTERQMRP